MWEYTGKTRKFEQIKTSLAELTKSDGGSQEWLASFIFDSLPVMKPRRCDEIGWPIPALIQLGTPHRCQWRIATNGVGTEKKLLIGPGSSLVPWHRVAIFGDNPTPPFTNMYVNGRIRHAQPVFLNENLENHPIPIAIIFSIKM